MTEQAVAGKTFDYGDKVVCKLDGEVMMRGEIVDIDLDSPWPYMVRDREADEWNVFSEDELEVWDDHA